MLLSGVLTYFDTDSQEDILGFAHVDIAQSLSKLHAKPAHDLDHWDVHLCEVKFNSLEPVYQGDNYKLLRFFIHLHNFEDL